MVLLRSGGLCKPNPKPVPRWPPLWDTTDNHRVLHGRTAFDADSGRRHLQGCYVDRDELRSRLRVLEHADTERAA